MSVQKPVKTSLPALPASAAPDMRMYLERVREELSRIQAGSSSTTVVIGGGSSSSSGTGGGAGGGGGGVDPGTLPCGAPVTPTAPTNFQVTAGFNFFMVEWDLPTYCGHSHTEVYGTKDDGAQGTEVLLGTTGGTIFSLAEPNTGVRRCFWAKHVNLVGVKGPYNGTEGTCDTTALDPGHLIEVLTGQITETQLYKDLGEKIEQLPEFTAAITDLNTATGELHEITDELGIGVTDLEQVTATQAQTIAGVKVVADDATAAIVAINTVSVSSTSANARQVAGLTASVGTAQADIVAINTVSATSTSASARQLAGLTVQYNDLNATVVNQGIAFANADQALAQQIDGVEALAQTGPAQRPNMCPNSNFEQDLTGVAYAGCAPYVDAGWSFGRALVANATNSTGCQVVFPQFRANPGDTLNVTFDAQVHNPTGPYVSFLRFYSALGNPFTPDRGSVDGTYRSGSCYLSDDPAQRTRFLVRAPAPAGTAYAAFGFYCAGGIEQLILRRPQACGGPLPMPPYSSEAAGSQTAARVATVETARIGYCSKNGETTADGTKEACQANGGVWNLGLPWATAVKQVSVTYNGQTVALQQQFSAISTDTGGLKAQYSVKIDNNGLVSGFGLASEPVTGGGSLSSFGVRADRFWIAAPTDTRNPGAPPDRLPFIVTTTGQWIDGEYFPPGVYVQEAFINAATISRARIKNLAVDTAKINDAAITTAKIGDLAVDTLKIAGNAVTAASFHETHRTELLTFSTEYSLNLFYVRLNKLIPYYYTVPGLPDGETAATIITASVVMYPVAGDTANRVLAVDLYVDDVPVSGAAMAVMADTMTATFVGMVYLDNRSHKISIMGRIPKKTTTLSKAMTETNAYVTIMSGKR
jgi:hypothetical protein